MTGIRHWEMYNQICVVDSILKNKEIVLVTILVTRIQRTTLWTVILIKIVYVCAEIILIPMLVGQVSTIRIDNHRARVLLCTKETYSTVVGQT